MRKKEKLRESLRTRWCCGMDSECPLKNAIQSGSDKYYSKFKGVVWASGAPRMLVHIQLAFQVGCLATSA